MTKAVYDLRPEFRVPPLPEATGDRVPHVTVHAFHETPATGSAIDAAAADRRLSRTRVKVTPGGISAAINFYRTQPTPDLLVLESTAEADALLAELAALAMVCDPDTKVAIIGTPNDIALYRELMDRGVDDYLVAPVDTLAIINVVSRIYRQPGAAKAGKAYAFIGARGGVGSSSIAQNVAWTMAQGFGTAVMLADMDLPFGTAGLNFNVESGGGITEQVKNADRLDEGLLERLLVKRGEYLRLLPSAAPLRDFVEPGTEIFTRLRNLAQSSFPFVVLDIPHMWSPWVRDALTEADEIVVTAVPDLVSLRNAKNLIDLLKEARPNDAAPRLVLNQIGIPKRTEIKPAEFAGALDTEALACFGFDPLLFSSAANNGQMLSEASPKAAICRTFERLAQTLACREAPERKRKGPWPALFQRR